MASSHGAMLVGVGLLGSWSANASRRTWPTPVPHGLGLKSVAISSWPFRNTYRGDSPSTRARPSPLALAAERRYLS
jgi:hypothetical protein